MPEYAQPQRHPVPAELLPGKPFNLIATRERFTPDPAATHSSTCMAYGYVIFEDVFGRRFQMGFGSERWGELFRKMPSDRYNYVRPLTENKDRNPAS